MNTDGGTISIELTRYNEKSGYPEKTVEQILETWREKFKLKSKTGEQILASQVNHIIVPGEKSGQCTIHFEIKVLNHKNDYVYINNVKTGKDEVYIRVNNKDVKTDKDGASYWKLVALHDFPIIKDYEPSDSAEKKVINDFKKKNGVKFKVIGSLPKGKDYFYKYMDLESALLSLTFNNNDGNGRRKKTSLRFVEPSYWDDQYEGRFYNAIFDDCDIDAKRAPFLYACCFSSRRENEAAWILYSHNKTGLASRCVEFTFSRTKLREQLVKNLKNCELYIGSVKYKSKSYIDIVNEPKIGDPAFSNEDYINYFQDFSIERYMNLLLLKRLTFEHEQEVRIFVVPDSKRSNNKSRRTPKGNLVKKAKPLLVHIDWLEVIREIKIDKNCTELEKSLLKEKLQILIGEKMAEIRKINAGKMTEDQFKEIENKFKMMLTLKEFDPYEDESLDKGPLKIKTNLKF